MSGSGSHSNRWQSRNSRSRRAARKNGLGFCFAAALALLFWGLIPTPVSQEVTAAPINDAPQNGADNQNRADKGVLETVPQSTDSIGAMSSAGPSLIAPEMSAGLPVPPDRPLPEFAGGPSTDESLTEQGASGQLSAETVARAAALTELHPEAGLIPAKLSTAPDVGPTGLQGLSYSSTGVPLITAGGRLPDNLFSLKEGNRFFLSDKFGDKLYFTVEADLQDEAERLLKQFRIPWGALVALDPRTGKVLAMASHSELDPTANDLAVRANFPAASLFKVITAAAAVERSGLSNETEIRFRGGNYTLSRYNYNPDPRRDRRSMALGIALGKSCNPAFARVALNNLSSEALARYAVNFGFNSSIPFEAPLGTSVFTLPADEFELARTAAGFQNSTISPIHAAMVVAAIANDGVMMRPYLVDSIYDVEATARTYQSRPTPLQQVVLKSTARELMLMMTNSVEDGTARKHFRRATNAAVRSMQIAGKTGTLRGPDPEGVYHWFIAAAPADDPQIAIASLVIDPGTARINGTGIARHFLEYYFGERSPAVQAQGGAAADPRS